MPYLNDDELASLHKVIDDAKKELDVATEELETTTEFLNEHKENSKKNKKSALIQNVILSIITGVALALAYYFYNNESNSLDINKIKQTEANRVLDSINTTNSGNVSSAELDDNEDFNAIEEATTSIKNNFEGQKIYSVQIGAFTKNRYTLLPETIAGISSNKDLFKYSVGLFETLIEAQDFRRELVKIGFKDAFVASYIDGIRQEIEQPN